MLNGVSAKQFFGDLKQEISDDNVSNGAAALAYYLMLAIFPAMIVLLSVLPYLPIANLDNMIMGYLTDALPSQAASMFTDVVKNVTSQKKGGLLSIGLLLTLWSASSGLTAIMEQLNITYDVKEGRPFWKVRLIGLALTVLFGVLIIGALSLVVFGTAIQSALAGVVGGNIALLAVFSGVRWLVIVTALLLGFALTYYLGPDVEQRFRFVSPGSAVGVVLLAAVSLVFKFYVDHFGNYGATYGSIGAVIILMLWLNVAGLVLLVGSEINALVEHYSSEGKQKGQKKAA
jgi:membrane protein